MIEINKLYNDDCLHKMQFIDDKSIDAIITDLLIQEIFMII